MAEVFIYSDVPTIAAELVGFAKQSGKEASVLAFSQEEALALAGMGADKVCLLYGESSIAEDYCKAVAAYLTVEDASALLVGATVRGRDFAARVAGLLDCAMVSDASSVRFDDVDIICERSLYGGAVVQEELLTGLSVVTVPEGKFAPASGSSEIITIPAQADRRVTVLSSNPIVSHGTDLKVAEKVVSVGMGMDKVEDLQMARNLAARLGAEIGCTRGIAEERHWLPIEQYIGISGCQIKPKLYLTMGVSGQVQHVFGVRDAKLIVAIDVNEKALIFRSADYGIVGDMYEIVPLLTSALG